MTDPKRPSTKVIKHHQTNCAREVNRALGFLRQKRKRKWTPKEEEMIQFMMGLIPILEEAQKDVESKSKYYRDMRNWNL